YLGLDVLAAAEEEGGPAAADGPAQLFPPDESEPDSGRRAGAAAAAVGLLAPVMRERIERAGLAELLTDVELPLSEVLAKMQAFGIALDVAYLRELSETMGDRMATLEAEIYRHAGEEFNLNSPPQLRVILYENLGLTPGKRTSKGALSTDAD